MQLLDAEQRQLLARIKHERHTQRAQLIGQLQGGLRPARSQDGQLQRPGGRRVRRWRVVHGAGMKCGDLVIGLVGGDETLRGILAGNCAHQPAVHPQRVQMRLVRGKVLTDAGQQAGMPAQRAQIVDNIAGAAAKLAAQARHFETHRQLVQLVGQQMVAERPVKMQQGVVGQRTANKHGHGEAGLYYQDCNGH